MAAIKLSFSLRTTSNVKQVHLIGSWDSYKGQLPLAREPSTKGSSSKGHKWKGTFRFSASLMTPGSRYWFYYMLDGYTVSHDPSKEFTVEPTTGRKLNILDVPQCSSSSSSSSSSSKSSRRSSRDIPHGRPAAEIRSPKPVRPGHLARQLEAAVVDQLAAQMESASLTSYNDDSDIDSDADSDYCPSLTNSSSMSSSSSNSPPSSCGSGRSTPSSDISSSSVCSCERYGITRKGDRVKLDCGGARCGYDEDSCEESEEEHRVRIQGHRHVRA